MSKGSSRRPQQAPDDQVKDSWEKIFGKKKEDKKGEKDGDVKHRLGGWSSLTIVLRYAHLAPSHVANWANNVIVTP